MKHERFSEVLKNLIHSLVCTYGYFILCLWDSGKKEIVFCWFFRFPSYWKRMVRSDENTDSERVEPNSDSDRTTTVNSLASTSFETELKSIINKLGPILGPLPPGQSRKIKYEKGTTAVEVKTPIEDKTNYEKIKEKKRKARFLSVSEMSSEESSKAKSTCDESTTSRSVASKESRAFQPYYLPHCNPYDHYRMQYPVFEFGPKFEPQKKCLKNNVECTQNFERCNHNVGNEDKKKKIKWSNVIPSFPSLPGSLPDGPKNKDCLKRKNVPEESSRPYLGPQFRARTVTGFQDHFDWQKKTFCPTEDISERRIQPEMRHYPRLMHQSPYVRAGPYPIGRNVIEAQNEPKCSTSNIQMPLPQPSVMQKICDDCHKQGDLSKGQSFQVGGRDYEVDPEKARAFLGEKGEGYISVNTIPERVDVYCFDQLNTGYFRTSDHPPPLLADVAVETTEAVMTRFWAEIFGFVHIIFAFFIAMFLQCFKFILTAIVRPILIGVVQLFSDYFIKPLLTLIYNGFTQPISIFLYNVLASIRDIVNPIAKGFGYFMEPFISLVKAFRIVEVKQVYVPGSYFKPEAPLCPKNIDL